MSPSISDFKAQMKQGGARANQFQVTLTFPGIASPGDATRQASFLCEAASLPASTIGNVPLLYRGKPVNFAGEREFAPWTVTIINDGSFLIRNAFERWGNAVANYDNTRGRLNPLDYQTQLTVDQLDRNEKKLKSYIFYDAYPTEVAAIQLSYETATIEKFDVTFQYNYFKPTDIV